MAPFLFEVIMPKVIMPHVTGISPTSGPAGTEVTIVGSGFVDGNNIHGVFFGGVPTHDWEGETDEKTGKPISVLGWVVVNDTTIKALAPVGHKGEPPLTGEQHVMVRTEGGIDNFGLDPVEAPETPVFTYTP